MNVLITRPTERGKQLVEMLAERQIFAIHQPLFEIEAGHDLPQLPSLLARLNAGDYLFAVSRNAVDFAYETLKQTGFLWRADLHYFAVGQSTAQYFTSLSEQGVKYPISTENSEGLLNLPEMADLQGKSVVILRGNGGRELFAEQATLRGANVQFVECYQRLQTDPQLNEKISLAKRVGIDTIVATSGEILITLVKQTDEENQAWLKSCTLCVVGERLARLAQKLGWQGCQIRISAKADNLSLLNTLL
ncbi:uroporphyrinogen-III synthase [Pasteurellaceae bacterium Macca]|nr:uroporphyrinogen-III synthase [Pasteurellaceae bacterium Macca]